MQPLNLEGKRFGKLVVLTREGSDAQGRAFWACVCKCGGLTLARADNLKTYRTRSCGCSEGNLGVYRKTVAELNYTPDAVDKVQLREGNTTRLRRDAVPAKARPIS